MYLSYVDESGDPSPSGSRHLILGAAALFEGRWTYVNRDIENLVTRYFPAGPRPFEIHCNEVWHRRGIYRRLSSDQSRALLTDFCSIIASMMDTEIRLFSVIYDKSQWFRANPAQSGYDLYIEAFENLVGRLDLFLRRRHAEGQPSKTLLVVDPHSTNLSSALRRSLQQLQNQGTRWGTLYNVIETVMFVGSHESPGIQLADLCSYAVHRVVNHNDPGLGRLIWKTYDREPMTSTIDPGKLHGLRYYGRDNAIHTAIQSVWPNYVRP